MNNKTIKNVKRILLSAVAGLALASSAHGLGTTVSANIATSQTWTKAGSPYTMTKQVFVTGGATLTIEPGVVVADIVNPADGTGSGSLAVCRDGKIKVMGTAAEPVIMTSAEDVALWAGSVVTRPATYVTAITTLGNPKTGTWREGVNEWGNLTLMGNALVGVEKTANNSNFGGTGQPQRQWQDGSGDSVHTNTGRPTGMNKAVMEGLIAINSYDPTVLYGGGDDDDSRGEIHYVSLRYGGKVIGLNNELNGLSLGGIGRGTQIDHVEVINNIDDAIEIWGGTVNLKYTSMWNYGDDGLDTDEGWRGKAQFGLIVQGYASSKAYQGGGISDNCFEFDGSEGPDAQPVTSCTIYNFTIIGQPDKQGGVSTYTGGDQGVAYRDGVRPQFRQCVWMEVGEKLISEEVSEGGTEGWCYGTFGTLPWAASTWGVTPSGTVPQYGDQNVWNTRWDALWDVSGSPLSLMTGRHPNMKHADGTWLEQSEIQALYRAQSSGNNLGNLPTQGYVSEITDSVFFNFTNTAAFTNSNKLGPDPANGKTVTVAGQALDVPNLCGNVIASSRPITTLVRGPVVKSTGTTPNVAMANVISLDPRPPVGSVAATSIDTAPLDGFFTPVRYRGAFSPQVNWLKGWTAADAYGFLTGPANPAQPTATFAVQMTTTTFQTVSGLNYVVESSADGRNWAPFATVAGDGSTKTVSALAGYDATKLYRVIVQ